MGVNNIPLTAFQRKAKGTVKTRNRVFSLDRQMDEKLEAISKLLQEV